MYMQILFNENLIIATLDIFDQISIEIGNLM